MFDSDDVTGTGRSWRNLIGLTERVKAEKGKRKRDNVKSVEIVFPMDLLLAAFVCSET